jgi:hypothetical protein
MADVLYLFLAVVFFTLMWGFAWLCQKLMEG